jgi:hypothetical protein
MADNAMTFERTVSTAPSASRIADRLALARRQRFVGRAAEVALFHSALDAATPDFVVLLVHGPGGIGKTTLVQHFHRLAQQAGRPVVRLDMRDVTAEPNAFLGVLCHALGIDGTSTEDVGERWARDGVLILDTFETATALDGWLREAFLPRLPARALVVIAGRTPPASAWSTDVEWAPLTRIISLRNLPPEESQAYLSLRGVAPPRQGEILASTYGHPLALSLAADAVTRADTSATFDLAHEPDLVQALLQKLLDEPPSAHHRLALYACATVPALNEAMLAAALDEADTQAVFDWLASLSFIEAGPRGLFPHDLARELLYADSRWRNAELRRTLNGRLLAYLYAQVQQAQGLQRQRLWYDAIYVQRYSPAMRPYYAWTPSPTAYADAARDADIAQILQMTERHEGAESAAIAAYWWQRQPSAFLAFRDLAGRLVGYAAFLRLEEATEEDRRVDPGTRCVLDHVARQGPLRAGEEILSARFGMAHDEYQLPPAAMNVLAATASVYWTTRPRLAWSFVALADPVHFEPMFTSIHMWRMPAADYAVGGRSYGVFGHDWRIEPVMQWLATKVERASAYGPSEPSVEPTEPLLVLSEADFAEAVRRALRDCSQRDALGRNPLLRTRLFQGRAATDALRALLIEATDTLKARPRDHKAHRALWHTYIEPVATQEQAAERIGLPFNTYRYQLARGTQAVTQWMWQREIGTLQ